MVAPPVPSASKPMVAAPLAAELAETPNFAPFATSNSPPDWQAGVINSSPLFTTVTPEYALAAFRVVLPEPA